MWFWSLLMACQSSNLVCTEQDGVPACRGPFDSGDSLDTGPSGSDWTESTDVTDTDEDLDTDTDGLSTDADTDTDSWGDWQT